MVSGPFGLPRPFLDCPTVEEDGEEEFRNNTDTVWTGPFGVPRPLVGLGDPVTRGMDDDDTNNMMVGRYLRIQRPFLNSISKINSMAKDIGLAGSMNAGIAYQPQDSLFGEPRPFAVCRYDDFFNPTPPKSVPGVDDEHLDGGEGEQPEQMDISDMSSEDLSRRGIVSDGLVR